MDAEVAAFLQYLREEKGYSANTIAAYQTDLAQLTQFIAAEKRKGMGQSYSDLLKSYLLKLKEKRYSLATMARKIASAKSFFRFLVQSGKLAQNPAQNLPAPQVKRHSFLALTAAEYHSLLAEAKRLSTPESKRDVMMLELLYATGLRISELVSLNVGDVDLEQSCLRLSSGRQVPLEPHVRELLAHFLKKDRLELLYDEAEQAVFLNRRGRRLTRQGLWQIIKNYAAKIGLEAKVTPRALRHSFAKRKLQGGIDLSQLQQLLGHAYISSTKVYKESLSRQEG
jgi:integrase/recombinase XerD